MLIKDTTYRVQTDIFDTEDGINIENGAIYLVDDKLKVHINNNIQEIPTAKYKVFTALLTQSGGDNEDGQSEGAVIKGVTYVISGDTIGADFLNVGAPNNNEGTHFIAINNHTFTIHSICLSYSC